MEGDRCLVSSNLRFLGVLPFFAEKEVRALERLLLCESSFAGLKVGREGCQIERVQHPVCEIPRLSAPWSRPTW